MSDLQCPARLFVGWPAVAADVLRWRRVVAAEGLAAEHDLRGQPVDLCGLADLHRGEAVLVLVDTAPAQAPDLRAGALLALVIDADGVHRPPTG